MYIVEIQKPLMTVILDDGLERCDVTFDGKTYHGLTVKKRFMRYDEYIYEIIVPVNPLPGKRYMLALGRDAIYSYKHPERQPFPEIHDSEPIKPKKKSKREKQGQMRLF